MKRIQSYGQKTRAAVIGSLLGLSAPMAAASDCTTGAKAAADFWNEYDKVARAAGCVTGTAASAIATAGATLPESAKIYADCMKATKKANKITRKTIKGWNNLNKNGWGTIGPRDLRLGKTYNGTIPSQGTRMFFSAPVNSEVVDLKITKRNERWNKGKTRVTICKFPPKGPGQGIQGEELEQFVFEPGTDNQGRTRNYRIANAKGYVLAVAFKGQSALKQMKYQLSALPVAGGQTILVRSSDVRGSTDYTIDYEGGLSSIAPVIDDIGGYDVSYDSNDIVTARTIAGSVGSGNDGYHLTGSVKSVSLDNPGGAEVLVGGRPWGQHEPDHILIIDSGNHRGGSDYRVVVSDRLVQLDKYGIGGNDSVSGNVATGRVGSGRDGFHVFGNIESIQLENPRNARVLVDGQPRQMPDHTVVIDGSAANGRTDYSVIAGKRIELVDGMLDGFDVTNDANDSTRGNRADGGVSTGADGLKVYGDIKSINVANADAAKVYVDGQPHEIASHSVVIDGSGGKGSTGYRVVAGDRIELVSGQLDGFNVTVGSNDNTRGNTANGRVVQGADGLRVYGDIETIELDNPGSATVYVDGDEREVSSPDSSNELMYDPALTDDLPLGTP